MQNNRLMTAQQVADLLGISRVHVWRMVKAGNLPDPLYLAPRSPRWQTDEIYALIENAPRRSSAA